MRVFDMREVMKWLEECFIVEMEEEDQEIFTVATIEQERLGEYYEDINIGEEGTDILEQPPDEKRGTTPELKPLPDQLRYAFLGEDKTYPVIISSAQTSDEEDKLLSIPTQT